MSRRANSSPQGPPGTNAANGIRKEPHGKRRLASREEAIARARQSLKRSALIVHELVAAQDAAGRVLAETVCWGVAGVAEGLEPQAAMFPQGHCLSPMDTGALLLASVDEVRVYERVRLTYVPTGDEVLSFRDRPRPGPGEVVESNSQVFVSLARQWGAQADSVPPVRDEPGELRRAVEKILRQSARTRPHIIVFGAGSSKGTKDFSRDVFESLGSLIVDGFGMVPGKSGKLAEVRGRLLVNVPGRPPGAMTVFQEIVAPLVAWLGHTQLPQPRSVPARLLRTVSKRPGLERLVPVGVGRGKDERLMAQPLDRSHGGMFASMVLTQGIVRMGPGIERLERGTEVEVELVRDVFPVERTVMYAGEPDVLLGRFSCALMALERPLRLLRLAGGDHGQNTVLDAVERGIVCFAVVRRAMNVAEEHAVPGISNDAPASIAAFAAPSSTSSSNRGSGSLHGQDTQGIVLAQRRTGLLVAPGNPQTIKTARRALASGARLVNLAPGCALRMESLPAKAGEEASELGVGACIAAGLADFGPGSEDVALDLGLGFVPMGAERIEAVFASSLEDDPVRMAVEQAVAALRAVRGATGESSATIDKGKE